MDPDATWVLMLEACEMAAHHDAAEHAEAMLNWLRSGGFPPRDQAPPAMLSNQFLQPLVSPKQLSSCQLANLCITTMATRSPRQLGRIQDRTQASN